MGGGRLPGVGGREASHLDDGADALPCRLQQEQQEQQEHGGRLQCRRGGERAQVANGREKNIAEERGVSEWAGMT